MRHKDDAKKAALSRSVVATVNELGFASSSIQKIAKRAGVSPATLYVYHENKEDLLVSTYLELKQELSDRLMADFTAQRPLREALGDYWRALFDYVSEHPDRYRFMDQFSSSPLMSRVDPEVLEAPYLPLYAGLETGIEMGVVRPLPRPTLLAFILAPAVFLAQSRLGTSFEASPANIRAAFDVAWDAVTVRAEGGAASV